MTQITNNTTLLADYIVFGSTVLTFYNYNQWTPVSNSRR